MRRLCFLLVLPISWSATSCWVGEVVDWRLGRKHQPQAKPDLSGVTHMADLIRSTWKAQLPPCEGLKTIPREVFEQVWSILGDTHYIDLWEATPPYIALAGDFNDLGLLRQFATRGVEGELSSFDQPAQIRAGLSRATGMIGPLAARLTRAGDARAEALALSFFLQCADPRFWRSAQVTWRRSNLRSVELGSAHDCILSAAYLSPSSFARVVGQVDSIIPQLSSHEVGKLRSSVAAATEIHGRLRTKTPFEEAGGGTPCRPDQ